jgi:hypothetical protein
MDIYDARVSLSLTRFISIESSCRHSSKKRPVTKMLKVLTRFPQSCVIENSLCKTFIYYLFIYLFTCLFILSIIHFTGLWLWSFFMLRTTLQSLTGIPRPQKSHNLLIFFFLVRESLWLLLLSSERAQYLLRTALISSSWDIFTFGYSQVNKPETLNLRKS